MNFGSHILNKKGLNEIISTVLLILLVILAIIIIWAFLRPSTEEGTKQIGTADDCLRIQLEPIQCTYNSCSYSGIEEKITAALSVRRTGRGALSDIIVVFTDANGAVRTIRNSDSTFPGEIPDEGEFMISGFFLGDFVPTDVQFAVVAGDNEHVCPLVSKKGRCAFENQASLGRCADTDGDADLDIFDYLNIQNFITEGNSSWDLTRDGAVDVQDFLAYCTSFSAQDCSGCSGYTTCTY